ncbi:MAG TPA: DUF6093 family protein, partial [Acidimicrobiales bacterium]
MPRPQQAHGRPGTPVLPAGWSAGHRPVVEATFTASCEIRHKGTVAGGINQTTGETTRTPNAPHYTGPCTVQVLPALEQAAVTGDQEVTTLGYRVTITYDAAPALKVDDLVKITAVDDNADPTLVGHDLLVQSFVRGSVSWERDIY